jgi:hypothetical protein
MSMCLEFRWSYALLDLLGPQDEDSDASERRDQEQSAMTKIRALLKDIYLAGLRAQGRIDFLLHPDNSRRHDTQPSS